MSQRKILRHSTSSSSWWVIDSVWAQLPRWLSLGWIPSRSVPTDSYLFEYSYLSGLLYEVILGFLRLITGFLGALWKNLAQIVRALSRGQLRKVPGTPLAPKTTVDSLKVGPSATTGSSTIGMLTQRGPPSCLQPAPL